MSTTSKALVAIIVLSLALAGARAEGIGSNNIGADIFGGIFFKKATSAPPTCAGAIDASVGCPLPMLGM